MIKPHRRVVQSIIRAEKARRNIEYTEISAGLAKYGLNQTPSNLSSKVSTGTMDAGLFLAVLDVIGVKNISIPDLFEDIRKAAPTGSKTAS